MKFDLPDPGEGIAEADLVEWQVDKGDHVEADDPVASVETDKAVVDIPIPEAGTIDDLLVDKGDTAIVGEPFLEYTPGDQDDTAETSDESNGEHTTESQSTDQVQEQGESTENNDHFVKPPEQPSRPVKAMPRVRHEARKQGIDLNHVDGTGPNNRVTLDDLKAVIDDDQTDNEDTAEDRQAQPNIETDSTDEQVEAPNTEGSNTADSEHTTTTEPASLSDNELGVDRFTPEGIKDAKPGTSHESKQNQSTSSEPTQNTETNQENDTEEDSHSPEHIDDETDKQTQREHEEPQSDDTDATTPEDVETKEPSTKDQTMEDDANGLTDSQAQQDKRGHAERADKADSLKGTRRVIAKNMRHSLESTAQTTITEEVDVTNLVNLHDVITEDNDAPITYLTYFVKAVTKTLQALPSFNATFDDDGVTEHDEVNLGIAVDTDRGLLVPVIPRADHNGLEGLAYSIADLAERTRANDNEPGDFDDATFTVSSLGNIGGEVFTPILNPPEVAILGVGRIKERPRYHDDELVKASIVHLSLTIDHQVIDGADAAQFLQDIKERLESPKDLLLINV